MLICLQRQEKVLPSSVVNEYVEEKVESIEVEQCRKVRRKERSEIKDQVTLEMLPQAFRKNRKTYGYLDLSSGFLVVDAATAKAAENFASRLRKSLGSLPVRPPAVNQSPAFTFTGWLSDAVEQPDTVALGEDCWMSDPSEVGGKVIARGLDLNSDEVRNHLDAGMQATKLAMTWDDNVSFCLDKELGITRLKFGDGFYGQLDDVDSDDALARFDAAFSLMTQELSRLIPGLLEALGGEDRTAIVEEERIEEQPSRQGDDDPLYQDAVNFVAMTGRASPASLQRHFSIGYNRAGNLIDDMENNGVISKAGHNGAREVLSPNPETVAA